MMGKTMKELVIETIESKSSVVEQLLFSNLKLRFPDELSNYSLEVITKFMRCHSCVIVEMNKLDELTGSSITRKAVHVDNVLRFTISESETVLSLCPDYSCSITYQVESNDGIEVSNVVNEK